MKKVYSFIGLLIVVCSMMFVGITVQAAPAVTTPQTPDDPEYGKIMNASEEEADNSGVKSYNLKSSSSVSPYTGLTYTHASVFDNKQIVNGIDVSYYQGTIDWSKVKEAGIKYVFIRAAYRGYGDAGTLVKDAKVDEYIQGAINAGLNVGAYIYSQAITEAEGKEEADYILNIVSKYNITMPVVIDYEYSEDTSGNLRGRLYNANLSKNETTAICAKFCETIQNAGYTPAVYANASMLTDQMNAGTLSEKYDIWLAHYTQQTTYTGDYTFWQYSSKGTVSGITGDADCDFWYQGYSANGLDYSAVFDPDYYLSKYGDVKAAYGDNKSAAFQHFLNYGMSEGRQGISTFDVKSYQRQYADLRRVYGSDLKSYYIHYINYGKQEGRAGTGCTSLQGAATVYNGINYSAVYDYNYYTETYSDVKKAYGEDDTAVLAHFVNYGMAEGRQGISTFDVNSYRNQYSDLRRAYVSNLKSYYIHYINYGKQEGRAGTGCTSLQGAVTVYNGINYVAVYDYNYYTETYSDVKKAYGEDENAVLAHFVNYGMAEGRQGISTFDVKSYRNQYSDLRQAYGNNLKLYYLHYINYGKKEGRTGVGCTNLQGATTIYNGINYSAVYDYNYYRSINTDVKNAVAVDENAVLAHFVNYGMKEGRIAKESFNVHAYQNRYIDLQNAYGNNLSSYYLHYINYGKTEGRIGN